MGCNHLAMPAIPASGHKVHMYREWCMVWLALNEDVCGHESDDSSIMATSDVVTSENYRRITSRVTKNSLFPAIYYQNIGNLMKTPIDRSTHHCCSVTMGQSIVVLWRHANIYCDDILTYCAQNVWELVASVFPPSSSSFVNYRISLMTFSLVSV